MGSELVSFAALPLPEGVRGGREGVGAEEGLRGVTGGAGGAMVSCSGLRSFESMVGAVLRSRAPPQVEQNRPLEETCAPQEEQYMGGEILPLRERRAATSRRRKAPDDKLRDALDLDGGAVGQDLGDALHHFGGVVAHADDSVCSVIAGVLQEKFVGVFASFLAKIGENRDVSADDGLQRRAEVSDDAARPDDDAAHDPEIANDTVTGEFGTRSSPC